MKIGFSNFEGLEWTARKALETAKELNFDGIELKEIDLEQIEQVKKSLDELGIEVPVLASGAILSDKENVVEVMQKIEDYSCAAQKLGVRYVSVQGDRFIRPEAFLDILYIGEALKAAAQIAGRFDVTILFETNGLFVNTKLVREVLESTFEENVGVLWNVNYTYRYKKEGIEESWKNVGDLIKYVRVPDLKANEDLPIKELVELLKEYKGYVSLDMGEDGASKEMLSEFKAMLN